jgi:hypothetical protein
MAARHGLTICAGVSLILALTICVSVYAKSDTRQEKSESYRQQFLEYLVSCALAKGQVVALPIDGLPHPFTGELGLAAEWAQRPMSEQEQKRVSACILARMNYSGRHIPLWVRPASSLYGAAPESGHDQLQTQDLAHLEGIFFGNLFSTPTQRYACWGEHLPLARKQLEKMGRVCALPSESSGTKSRCGIELVGACSRSALVRDGADYLDSAMVVFVSDVGDASDSTPEFPPSP